MDRRQLAGERAGPQGLADHFLGDRLAFEDAFDQFVVGMRAASSRCSRYFSGHGLVLLRDLDPGVFHVRRIVLVLQPQLHANEVDDAFEVARLPGRDGAHGRDDVQLFLHLLDAVEEVGPHAIELVDEGDARHAMPVGLVPDGFALHLDAADGAEDADGAVEDAGCVRPRR